MRAIGSVVLSLLVLTGCSFSASSESSSDSSASSSRSSAKDGDKAAYRQDIRTFTAAHVSSGGSPEAFEKKLGEVARLHRVTNWEEDQATYVGIGQGLGEARASDVQLAAYKAHFSGSNALKRDAIQQGYDTKD